MPKSIRKGRLVRVVPPELYQVSGPIAALEFKHYSPDAIFTVLTDPYGTVRTVSGYSQELKVVDLLAPDGGILLAIGIAVMEVVS